MFSRIASLCLIGCILSASVAMPAFSDDKKADQKTEKKAAEKKVNNKKKRPTEARLKKMFGKKDKDGDGFLTSEEFVVVGKKLTDEAKIAKRKKALGRQFARRDKNKDGKLSSKEFVAQLKKSNKKQVNKKKAGKKKNKTE